MRVALASVVVVVVPAGVSAAEFRADSTARRPGHHASHGPSRRARRRRRRTAGTPAVSRVIGRVLSLDEAIGIALETQPLIQARLYDYMAAAHRVDQAFAPLLPQLTGGVDLARTQSAPRGRRLPG